MLEGFNGDPSERAELSVHMMRTKVAIFDAVLTTTGELHRVAGGRATSNKYRMDRFWRNGRTLSVHDPVDAKLQPIGAYELDGSSPRSHGSRSLASRRSARTGRPAPRAGGLTPWSRTRS
jgi:hypothetical protein